VSVRGAKAERLSGSKPKGFRQPRASSKVPRRRRGPGTAETPAVASQQGGTRTPYASRREVLRPFKTSTDQNSNKTKASSAKPASGKAVFAVRRLPSQDLRQDARWVASLPLASAAARARQQDSAANNC